MATDLALVNKELEDVVAERALLREKHKGATLPQEARARDLELNERAKKLQFVVLEEEQAKRDKEFAELNEFINEPRHLIPTAVNADDEGRRVMMKAGWETKGGYIIRHTSQGEFALYPEDVVWGPIPSHDAVTAKYYNQTRRILQPDYRSAFIAYLKAAAISRSEGQAESRLTTEERNALSEGLDEKGGYLVPPDLQAEMLSRAAQASVMRRISRVITTSRDKVQFPALKPHASSGSLYSSGFVGDWAGETPAFSETDPNFELFEISIKKIRVATKLSNDFLADAGSNVLGFLTQNGAENMALVEDFGFISGTGTGLQPMGILNAGITTVDVEGSTSNTVSNSTSNAGSAPKITALEYQLPAQYSNNASFLMRRAIEGDVRALVDGNGRPYWLGSNDSGFGGTPRTLDGYPVYNSDAMENDGADAAKVLVFGDFRNYIIAQRAQISTVVLRERFADTDQTGLIIFERVGGGVWNTDAFRIGVV